MAPAPRRRPTLPRSPVLRRTLFLGVAFLALEAAAFPLKGRVVGPGLEAADLVSLGAGLPLLALLYYRLYRALKPAFPLPPALKWLALLSFALFFTGFGIHAAANDVHNAMDRLLGFAKGHGHELPEPVAGYSTAHFYDEVLGHKMAYAGLAGLFAAGLWLQFLRPQKLDPDEARGVWLLAPVFGFGFAFILLEGQTALEGLVVALFGPPALWEAQRRSREPWSRLPLAALSFGALLWMALFLLAWRLWFGGFAEPSVVWGI
ncbi:MAG: hypothetical protein QXO51_08155 [Halobacteria archaeon]